MSHGENALMEAMKPAGRHSSLGRVVGVTQPPQLTNRDHTMLTAGESCQRLTPP
ncbi:MAG TPA: hypothetical protein VFI17_02410 [Solirubrobacterales bacterium]|nr:hypothetical protein [Solirubrobacterales bacterium]